MTDRRDIVVVGAGPTGLGAAQRLEELGCDWELLEATQTAGGLAGSFTDGQGFTWDYGGHVQHSHYDSFDRAMDTALGPEGWLVHRRHSSVWMRGRFIPYPFQHHLHHLDADDCQRALDGLRDAARHHDVLAASSHFDEWIVRSFGAALADLFMRPYNRKVWQFPLAELDHGWTGDRVAVVDVDRLARAVAEGRDDDTWGPNATFRYPRQGGTGAPWRAIAAALPVGRVRYGQRVAGLDLQRREVVLTTGERRGYQHLVSTLPLDMLLTMCGNPAAPVAVAPGRLRYSSIDIVGLGLEGTPPAHLAERCWMYFPESSSPYFRVTLLSRYSPLNVPAPGRSWSLMAEVASLPDVGTPASALVARVRAALEADGLLPAGTPVLSLVHQHCERGYPTPFLGRDATVEPILQWFEQQGVFSRGRFGGWKYEVSNQDHSFAQGREVAERLHHGGDRTMEPTLWTPALVNRRRNA
ncbi:MAG: FAD-dependent oxidoreductase [Acidobacteria bacterium]|nr:FAD-dependent oxidoreductase [Acidobacteriota bacterium]